MDPDVAGVAARARRSTATRRVQSPDVGQGPPSRTRLAGGHDPASARSASGRSRLSRAALSSTSRTARSRSRSGSGSAARAAASGPRQPPALRVAAAADGRPVVQGRDQGRGHRLRAAGDPAAGLGRVEASRSMPGVAEGVGVGGVGGRAVRVVGLGRADVDQPRRAGARSASAASSPASTSPRRAGQRGPRPTRRASSATGHGLARHAPSGRRPRAAPGPGRAAVVASASSRSTRGRAACRCCR